MEGVRKSGFSESLLNFWGEILSGVKETSGELYKWAVWKLGELSEKSERDDGSSEMLTQAKKSSEEKIER